MSPITLAYVSASLIAIVFHLGNIFKAVRVASWPYRCLQFLGWHLQSCLSSNAILWLPSYCCCCSSQSPRGPKLGLWKATWKCFMCNSVSVLRAHLASAVPCIGKSKGRLLSERTGVRRHVWIQGGDKRGIVCAKTWSPEMADLAWVLNCERMGAWRMIPSKGQEERVCS